MKKFFTVIGGMGTAATESYVRLLNARTPAKKDQDYLNYILVNHATVPDRTSYILDHDQPSFYPALLDDIKQQNLLNPEFIVMVCNTAHYFYEDLQKNSKAPILHMPRITIQHIRDAYPEVKRVGLIATKGTLADGIYENELKRQNYDYTLGDDQIKKDVMTLIYDDIKEKGTVDHDLYHSILKRMHDDFGAEVIVLGCTELSLAQEKAPDHPYKVADSQSIIVDKSIELAEKIRKGEKVNF